ncbi:hypothetical protein FDECE_6174 [Fusarium decemcellulare]|nr:hypothetical protein FDECE_6174 [Fusarium decemcellulare]
MLREIGYSLAGLVLLAYAVEWALSLFDDAREPRRLQSKVPLVGHLLGMIQHGAAYYGMTSKTTDAEVYTLNIFHTKLYVTKTQRLTPSIQKAAKTLSFRPFMQTAAKLMGDASTKTYDIFGSDFIDDFSHSMKTSLAPGVYLDEQNLRMGKRAMQDVDALSSLEKPTIFLHEWVKHTVVQASSCGLYGEAHPYLDQAVEDAFWTWQSYLPLQMVGLDLRGKAKAARQIVFDAYKKYCDPLPNDVSQLIRERSRTMREAGVSEEEIYKQESTFGTAAFANTVPALYWSIYELFSRPDVLEEVRAQIAEQAITGTKESGFVVDVAALKTKCPLLLSVYQETQRTRHIHANIRKVTADTLLDGRYLLKAGNYVQMPGQPIHTNPDIWGSSADAFDPYRFVKTEADRKSVSPSSFLAWGAPPHLCPARQFATTEILIVIALLAMKYDLTPKATGMWERNPQLNIGDMVSMYLPKKDVELEVKEREAWSGIWSLEMGESKTRISLASG